MIIAFAFGLIGALLVLNNYKYLRHSWVTALAFLLTAGVSALGIYFILNASKETDCSLFFPLFTPLTSLILLHFTRLLYKKRMKQEIIFYMYGLFPVKHEERYVTRPENYITFIVLVLSVVIPYIILTIVL